MMPLSRTHHAIAARTAALLALALAGCAPPVAAQNLSYLKVAGSSFVSRDESTTSVYGGAGCISRGTGTSLFVYSLQLPLNSRIKYVRAYFNDTTAANLQFALTRYDGLGGFTDEAAFSNNSTAGYGSVLSTELDVVIDPSASASQLIVLFGESSTSHEFCGMRVAYIAEVIFANGFEP